MKLDILQQKIASFAGLLLSRDGHLHAYKYEILDHFKNTWTFDTDDFTVMYDRALQSNVTRRWWKKDTYRPKEMMLQLIQSNPEYARQAFKELFNETKSIENRIDSFIFYSDELLRMYKKANPKSIENNHYQDSIIISLYLSAMYPHRYTLYPGRVIFQKALDTLHAKAQSDKDDLPRFFKVCSTIYQFLEKDTGIKRILDQSRRPQGNLLLSHEFISYIAGEWENYVPA